MTDERNLDGLREEYGSKLLVCDECGHEKSVSSIIDAIEEQELDTIFTPKKIDDLAFARCDECGETTLHELEEPKFDAIEPKEQSSGQSKSQNEADGQSEPDEQTSSTGSNKTFSL